MLRKFIVLLTVVGLALVPIAASAEEITVEGGPSSITTIYSPIKAAYEEATGDRLTLVQTNPTKAMIALAKGEVDVASIASLAFVDAIGKAKKQGIEIAPADFSQTPVTKSNVVIFLERNNPVSQLSREQVKGIFTGKISNWKEVGGADLEIQLFWTKEIVYVNSLFIKMMLDGQPISPKAKIVDDLLTMRKAIIATAGAIAISPEGLKMPLLKIPQTPTLPLEMVAFTKGPPSAKVQRLLNFYREEFGYMDEQ